MARVKIKICGLTRLQDIAAVNLYLPDFIGFVFAPGSRRRVTPRQALLLKEKLDPRIKTVGVFTNETVPNIAALCEEGIIDLVQLHGDESAEFIRALKEQTPSSVIKAVRVRSKRQILQAQQLPCDLLLLDAYREGQYGGSGRTFDHSLIPPLQKAFFLAGGLNEGNIEQAVLASRPFAVDISSGVETNGVKDEKKIGRIIAAIRKDRKKETIP